MSTHKDNLTGAVLVAGGSGGVGRSICASFAGAGFPVAFTYHRNRSAADELVRDIVAAGGSADAHQLDLRDAEAAAGIVETAAIKFGALHSVVYAAGPSFEMNFVFKVAPKSWAEVFAADVNGCFNLFSAALQVLRRQKRGNLVALTTCALNRPPKADILSAAPKAAIDMLVRTIAKEEGRNGIRANCVELGFIDAGLAAYHLEHTWSPEIVERIKKETPLGRFGRADEVANAVAFLCSDRAAFITGQALAVDGGASL